MYIILNNVYNIKYFLKIDLTVTIATYSECLPFLEYLQY